MNSAQHQRASDAFYVSLHDVTPVFVDQIRRVIDAVGPLVGNVWSAAIVPQWHGLSVDEFQPELIEILKSEFQERLLHGYFHQRERGRGLISLLTNGADELNGLGVDEIDHRLFEGQRVMRQLFGRAAEGYVAPTFQSGRLTMEMLSQHGVEYLVGAWRAEFADGRRTPLSTCCWDVGQSRTLCPLSERVSTAIRWLRPHALPHVTIHPADVDRGLLGRVTQLLQFLLDSGRRPLLMADLLTTNQAASP